MSTWLCWGAGCGVFVIVARPPQMTWGDSGSVWTVFAFGPVAIGICAVLIMKLFSTSPWRVDVLPAGIRRHEWLVPMNWRRLEWERIDYASRFLMTPLWLVGFRGERYPLRIPSPEFLADDELIRFVKAVRRWAPKGNLLRERLEANRRVQAVMGNVAVRRAG